MPVISSCVTIHTSVKTEIDWYIENKLVAAEGEHSG